MVIRCCMTVDCMEVLQGYMSKERVVDLSGLCDMAYTRL